MHFAQQSAKNQITMRSLSLLLLLLLPGGCRSSHAEGGSQSTPSPSTVVSSNTTLVVSVSTTSAVSASAAPDVLASAPPAVSAGATPTASAIPPVDEICGEGMVKIGTFCVDAYEAHLEILQDDGQREPWPHFQRPPTDRRYAASSAAGYFPQGYISRVEAATACKNAGKRLCSLGEWRRACEGKHWRLYGYSNKRKAGNCNSGKDHLLSKLYGTNGRAWKYDEHFNNPELNQLEGFLARSGDYSSCTAGEGVFDMVGNLHEWVSDTLDDGLKERLEKDNVERRKQPMRDGNGLFVGGFFSTTSELGPGCMYVTAAHEPSYHDYSTGFRCCRSIPKTQTKTSVPSKH